MHKKNKLKDYCLISEYGIPAKAIEYNKNLYRYLRISDISDDGVLLNNDIKSIDDKNADKYLLSENDIVFARTGNSTGRTFFYEKKYGNLVFAGFLIKYKIDPTKINPKILKYYTISKQYKHWVKSYQDGSTRGNMSAKSFDDLPIPTIDRKQQDKIVLLLDSITNKIEFNNKINCELEKMAKELYDYWFVQFNFPDKNNRPYKSNNGKMIYNPILKREIPFNWKVQNLYCNDLTTIIEPGIEFFSNQKIYLPTASIDNDKIIDFSNTITFDNRESRANMQPTENSIWFAKMKKSKKILYFCEYSKEYLSKFIISTGMCVLHCKEKTALEYIWNLISSSIFEQRKDIIAHGATQQAVNNEDLAFIPLLIPNKEILNLYHLKTKDLYYKKYINEIENYNLIQLRDFLLPMLMNGQISIED